jgi:hypothetical protein
MLKESRTSWCIFTSPKAWMNSKTLSKRLTNGIGNTEASSLMRHTGPRPLRLRRTNPTELPKVMTNIKVRTKTWAAPTPRPEVITRARRRRSQRVICPKVSQRNLTLWINLVRMANSQPKIVSTAKIITCAYSAARLDIECASVQGLPWPELQRCLMGRLPSPKLRLQLWLLSQKKNSQRPYGHVMI